MPRAYLQDVQEAVIAAWHKYNNRSVGNFQQHFEVGAVTIISEQKGNMWNYGHPTMYRMWDGNIAALQNWWREVEPQGVMLPKIWKPMLGCYEVNLQTRGPDGRLFNYHVAVEAIQMDD